MIRSEIAPADMSRDLHHVDELRQVKRFRSFAPELIVVAVRALYVYT